MKAAITLPALLCISIIASAEVARPILKRLAQPELVPYPAFGFELLLPTNTELVGKRIDQDADNYVFPWIRTQYWNVDFAYEYHQPKGSLDDRVLRVVTDMAKRQTPIRAHGKIEGRTFGGIRFDRVPCEGSRGYKIMRYYFITPDDQLAYFHVHGTDEFDAFETMFYRTIKKT